MRKTERDYEKQFGGFVPPGIVKGQSRRRNRPADLQPEPQTEVTPKPEPEVIEPKKGKG